MNEAVKAGPEAAGYTCGCWITCLFQEWIYHQFGVLCSRYYVTEFAKLIQSVEDVIVILAAQTEAIIRLMGAYTKLLIDSAAADPLSNSFS